MYKHQILFAILAVSACGFADGHQIASPDGQIQVQIELSEEENEASLFYSLFYKEKPVIQNSLLGVDARGIGNLYRNVSIQDVKRREQDGEIALLYGERRAAPDVYHEMDLEFASKTDPDRALHLVIRAYNEGVAFCYRVPKQADLESISIVREKTQFRFVENFEAWEEHGTEGEYLKAPISSIQPKCETPLTVELAPGGPYACLMEAQVVDYPRMWLSPEADLPNALAADLGGEAEVELPFQSPWRVVMFADRPGEIVEQNYFLQILNLPSVLEDESWIKPGTVIRCVRLNTGGCQDYIDFAAEHRIDYVHLDAGWYGPERDPKSDPRKPKDDLDLPFLIDYAKKKGVGMTVYVNRIALDKYWKELFPLYRQWGLKGIKFGFVAVGPQEKMKWLYDAVEWAGKNQLMVDIHDSYRPSGLSRTLPNLMTQEGIRGNEHMPAAEHNATLPFTRYAAGAADYTICYYNKRIKNTHAHQLAASIVMYSPLQFVFWYDTPDLYQGEPEIEWFENLPVVWDETRVLDGAIGDFIVMARQSGEEWRLAVLTDDVERDFEIALDFLAPGRTYAARVYRDDLSVETSRTGVKIERKTVKRGDHFSVTIPAAGGCAVRFSPASQEDIEALR
ncbi:MAG: glycoside hydrolase family 97 catalytic domain-containing protein [Candidatus Omnitrophica bacterium]|nr:glycoside hydrolase family 97 catalytic domain-containing protein [Candidatus Omnitrophota bacterium]